MSEEQIRQIHDRISPLLERHWAALMGIGIGTDSSLTGPWAIRVRNGESSNLQASLNRKTWFAYAETKKVSEMILVYDSLFTSFEDAEREFNAVHRFSLTGDSDGRISSVNVFYALHADSEGYRVIKAGEPDEKGFAEATS